MKKVAVVSTYEPFTIKFQRESHLPEAFTIKFQRESHLPEARETKEKKIADSVNITRIDYKRMLVCVLRSRWMQRDKKCPTWRIEIGKAFRWAGVRWLGGMGLHITRSVA